MAQEVKNLSVMQDTQVQSLDWDDPLEKVMATHSSILAWRIPWTEEPGGLQPVGHEELDTTEQLTLSLSLLSLRSHHTGTWRKCLPPELSPNWCSRTHGPS